MFFRNLSMFRFPAGLDLSELAARLAEHPVREIGPLEMSVAGFQSPLGRDSEELAVELGETIWLAIGGFEKILPGPVVNAELHKRIEAFENNQGRKPGGKMRKQMKDDLLQELMPKALVKPVRADALIFKDIGVVMVNTSSRKAAENFVSAIRTALGSFPVLPLNAEVSPRGVLTGWISGDPLPEGLALGEDAVLEDPSDHGAVARLTRQDLQCEEVSRHLEAGKQVTRLGLNLDDHVTFALDEDLSVRKLKLLDGALDKIEKTENDDMRAEINARLALMDGEIRRLWPVLEGALKISSAE